MENYRFGLIKTKTDAHTMGLVAVETLLKECGFEVFMATKKEEFAIETIDSLDSKRVIIEWIVNNRINSIGFSYRLDPKIAVIIFGKLLYFLKNKKLYSSIDAQIKQVFFAGLPEACAYIDKEFSGKVVTFKGGERPEETLGKLGISKNFMSDDFKSANMYDEELLKFGREVVKSGNYHHMKPFNRCFYPGYGELEDSIEKRIRYVSNVEGRPVFRAHAGPYLPDSPRVECLELFNKWGLELSKTGYLDVLSIGTSQLSQSNFGESWSGKINGGGVPINSKMELINVWHSTRPMLVRTYSATKNITQMARLYEETINNAWHALSLWWFNELDGRGANTLYGNLKEHILTMKYIAMSGYPFEANVPHQFAFRGCDDLSYVISGYLAAKMSKQCGIKTFILQNMLNTPRSTWGIQDISKSRALLSLCKSLVDDGFRIILQTRAGLDYFKPDIEEAKVQLAAVTALMDDIEPYNNLSPEIIHVVSYSEALFLANPDIINDSIKITMQSLSDYRKKKKARETYDVINNDEINDRYVNLIKDAKIIINAMEEYIPNLYSPEGFYLVYVAGWIPTPGLVCEKEEYKYAKNWIVKHSKGGFFLAKENKQISNDERINICVGNLEDARYYLNQQT